MTKNFSEATLPHIVFKMQYLKSSFTPAQISILHSEFTPKIFKLFPVSFSV